MQHVLIVVHPGSALGSADFNLGRTEATAAREALVQELDQWEGPLLIIHGELSEELYRYPQLDQALRWAQARNTQAGFPSHERDGCDENGADANQEAAIQAWVDEEKWDPQTTVFRVSGAWYHPEDQGGCVGSVISRLKNLGYQAEVSPSVVVLPSGDPESTLEVVAPPSAQKPRALRP